MAQKIWVCYALFTVSFHIKFESCFGYRVLGVGELACGIVIVSWLVLVDAFGRFYFAVD